MARSRRMSVNRRLRARKAAATAALFGSARTPRYLTSVVPEDAALERQRDVEPPAAPGQPPSRR